MNLKYSKIQVSTLVGDAEFSNLLPIMFVTISPNPKLKLNCMARKNGTNKMRNIKLPYGMAKQRLQYDYCIKILREDYMAWLSDDVKIVGVAELNKDGNIHLHMLIQDKNIRNDVQLQVFRRDVLNGWHTQQNIRTGMNGRDWMNNIVFLNTTIKDITSYLEKDNENIRELFDNYFLY